MDQRRYPFFWNVIFRSRDVDKVRRGMAGVMCPHVLKPLEPQCELDALMTSMRLNELTVSYVRYGALVYVGPGRTESFMAVQVPIVGQSMIRNGSAVVESSPQRILVSRHDEPLDMTLSSDTQLLLSKVPMPFVRQKLSDVLGGLLLDEDLRFEPGMDVTHGIKQRWLEHFVNHIQHVHLFARQLYLPQFEERFVLGLLMRQPNNYSEILRSRALPAKAAKRREAMDLLQATPDAPHTEGTVAREVDVSLRSLQVAFRRQLGVTVGQYLVEVRLRRARQELILAAPDEVTVREIAARWGFVEPDFSLRYIATYGEWPDDTLRGY